MGYDVYNENVALWLKNNPSYVLMTRDLLQQYGVFIMIVSFIIGLAAGALFVYYRKKKAAT